MTRIAGAILVGGAGTRLGADKPAAEVGGRRLVDRAWGALAPATGSVVLQGVAQAPPGLSAVPDRRPGQGPLAGLETALARAGRHGRPGVAVLAVDLPRVTAPVILALAARWRGLRDAENRAVIAGTPVGIQPLAGVYGAGLASSLSSRLDGDGSRAVHAWLEACGDRIVTVPWDELRAAAGHDEVFLNVNAPEDLARARALAPVGPPVISVVGWKDSGKTSVAVELVRGLGTRGLRVAALKHGHGFRLDAEGTDSWRLRHEGGAGTVILAGPEGFAAMGSWPAGRESSPGALAARFAVDADVVVAEGWKRHPLPAVEVVGARPSDPGEGSDPDPPLWRADGNDRDRFLARVGPEAGDPDGDLAGDPASDRDGDPDGEPPLLARGGTDLAERLAALVLPALLPERANP